MYKVLVVDDESHIRSIIRKYGEYEGYKVYEAESGEKAIELCSLNHYDIIIMDVMMPGLDGFDAVKEIRKTNNVPIIMLSARGEEYDRIQGFEVGIDDYVVKPFSIKELMMRINAILKRIHGKTQCNESQQYTYQGLKIDYRAHRVFIDEEEVILSPKEYSLLVYMVKNEGIALTREQFIRDVWGYDFYGDDRTLDTHIKLLRKSLKQYSTLISTLRGVGYRFETK